MSTELEKANKELDFAIDLHKKLDAINTAILVDKETMEELVKQIHHVNQEIIPICKKLVSNLVEIRMQTGREVEYILQSCRNLKGLANTQTDLRKYIDEVLRLDEALKAPKVAEICKMLTVAVLNDEVRVAQENKK